MNSTIFTDKESLMMDYVKAIGIITVVIGHYPNGPFNFFQPYIYHMPLFFFLGGVLFKPERSFFSQVLKITKNHLFYIISVYFFVGLIIWAIHKEFSIHYSSLWKGGMIESIFYPIKNNFHGGSYFLVAWFLLAFFFVSIVAPLGIKTIRLTKKWIIEIPLLLAFSVVTGYTGMEVVSATYSETKFFYYNILSQVLVGSSFYFLGHLIRPLIVKISGLYGFVFSFFIIYVVNQYGLLRPMVMSWSQYPLGYYAHTLNALLCIYSVFCLSKILSEYKHLKLFRLIGRNSKPIMSFHLLAFVFIDIYFYLFGYYEISKTGPLSHYFNKNTWPIYIILGTVIPIVMHECYQRGWGKLASYIKRVD